MELTLKRELIFPDAIHGKIYYRNKPICCTLENPRTYVPAGKYQLKLVKEKGEKEFLTPYLYREDAHHHTCAITKGNGVCNLLTFVIYAGKYQCRGLVIRCEEYLKRLNEWIVTKRENEKEKIYLKIEDYAVN